MFMWLQFSFWPDTADVCSAEGQRENFMVDRRAWGEVRSETGAKESFSAT
jgi:hypothetical protein